MGPRGWGERGLEDGASSADVDLKEVFNRRFGGVFFLSGNTPDSGIFAARALHGLLHLTVNAEETIENDNRVFLKTRATFDQSVYNKVIDDFETSSTLD